MHICIAHIIINYFYVNRTYYDTVGIYSRARGKRAIKKAAVDFPKIPSCSIKSASDIKTAPLSLILALSEQNAAHLRERKVVNWPRNKQGN